MQESNILRKMSKRDELRKRIVTMILTGAIGPGEKLREQRLAKRLRVSRTPLREALIGLERDGYVEAQPNTGFSVLPLSRKEAEELYPIVGELEALALEMCFDRTRTIVDRLAAVNKKFISARKDPTLARKLDQEFHRILIGSCDNLTLHSLLASLNQKLERYESRYMQEENLVNQSFEQHNKIIAALKNDNRTAAMKALRANWLFGMHAYLARNLVE